MVRRAFRTSGWGAALAAQCAGAPALLPTDYGGPWQDAVPPTGWTFDGLGLDAGRRGGGRTHVLVFTNMLPPNALKRYCRVRAATP